MKQNQYQNQVKSMMSKYATRPLTTTGAMNSPHNSKVATPHAIQTASQVSIKNSPPNSAIASSRKNSPAHSSKLDS